MFDLGWSEIFVIGALALIVVGPKDLPKLLHQAGKYMAHARRMAADFQRSMEEAAREADVSNMKDLRDAANQLRDLKRLPYETITAAPRRTTSAAGAAAQAAPVAGQAPPAPQTPASASGAAAAPTPAAPTPAAPTSGEGA